MYRFEVTHVTNGHNSVQVVAQWTHFEEQAGPHLHHSIFPVYHSQEFDRPHVEMS